MVEAAKKNNISTIVVASTTGDTALKLSELAKKQALRLIVVTHDEGRPPKAGRFNEDIRKRLLADNRTVYTYNPRMIFLRKAVGKISKKLGLSPWRKHLDEVNEKYGTGIKVCHIIVKMLIDGKVLQDTKAIAVAGKRQGADSAAVFSINPKDKQPVLEEVIAAGRV